MPGPGQARDRQYDADVICLTLSHCNAPSVADEDDADAVDAGSGEGSFLVEANGRDIQPHVSDVQLADESARMFRESP